MIFSKFIVMQPSSQSSSRTLPSPQEVPSSPLAGNPCFHLLFRQPLACILPMEICLFCKINVNHRIWSICVWHFSLTIMFFRFIHVSAVCSFVFLSGIHHMNIAHSVYLFTIWWSFGSIPPILRELSHFYFLRQGKATPHFWTSTMSHIFYTQPHVRANVPFFSQIRNPRPRASKSKSVSLSLSGPGAHAFLSVFCL